MRENKARNRWMLESENAIVKARPELKGKFNMLRIWDDLLYLYTCNGITPAIASERILKSENLKKQCDLFGIVPLS